MKKNILSKMLYAALMVSLTVPNLTAIAAQEEIPKMDTREEVYVGAGEGSPEITPYFSTDGHVYRQCAYVVSHLNLNPQQRAAMEQAAQDADSLYGSVRGFHARMGKGFNTSCNYLANLKALEICGVRIDKEPKLKDYVLGRMPNLNDKDETDVRQLLDATLSYVNDSSRNYTREQKQYAIAGFGVHLIGDMFAHRTIIKKIWLDSWDQPDTDTTVHLKKNDFKKELLPEFEAKVRAGELCTVGMRAYMAEPSGKYIDDIKFMPSRIKAAERAAASFVETVFKKGLAFPDINYYLTEYNLQLEYFSEYKASL